MVRLYYKRYETMALCLPLTIRPCLQIDVKNFRAKRPGYKITWNIWIDYHGIQVSLPKHMDLVPTTPKRLLQDAANLHSPESTSDLLAVEGTCLSRWATSSQNLQLPVNNNCFLGQSN